MMIYARKERKIRSITETENCKTLSVVGLRKCHLSCEPNDEVSVPMAELGNGERFVGRENRMYAGPMAGLTN